MPLMIPDTRTTTVYDFYGNATKTIHTEASDTRVIDALADRLHVLAANFEDGAEDALRDELWGMVDTALGHFKAEQAGEDDVKVQVI